MTDAELEALVAAAMPSQKGAPQEVAGMKGLCRGLEGELVLPELAHLLVPRTNGPTIVISTALVAHRMLDMARRSSPANAVRWLRRIPSLRRSHASMVRALVGISCRAPIRLSSNVELVPFDQVPESITRNELAKLYERPPLPEGTFGAQPGPHTALICNWGLIDPLFIHPHDLFNDEFRRPAGHLMDELEDATLLLGLVEKAIPVEGASWMHFHDPDVMQLVEFGVPLRDSALESSQISQPTSRVPVEIHSEGIEEVVPRFQALDPSSRERVRIALQRLLRSRCHLNPGNRAIDLAISFEVLLMNADRDRHAYKIGLRASRLLATDPGGRDRVSFYTRRLYEMRSSMVHRGTIAGSWVIEGQNFNAHHIVDVSDRNCVALVRALLKMGSIPRNWSSIEST